MKALILNIRDAGIFDNPRISKTKDKVLSINGVEPRKNTPYISIKSGNISIKHIANLLRVLFGERPVPSLRKVHTLFKGDLYFEEKAKKCRIKIETPIFFKKIKDDNIAYYPEEKITIRKSVKDSWQTSTIPYFLDNKFVEIKGGILYPDRLRRYLGLDLFTKFVALVNSYGGAFTIQAGIELLNRHKNENDIIEFCAECKIEKRSSISNIILNDKAESITMHQYSPNYPLDMQMACSTIQKIEKFSASLYVPVDGNDLNRIDAASGVATFLEGGLVTIQGVEYWSSILELNNNIPVEGLLCT